MTSIAIIDEDPLFRAGLSEWLALHKFPVMHEAQSGEAGLAGLRKNARKPAVVLLQSQLPDMSGESVCRWVHRRFPHIATIVLLSPLHWPTLSRLITTPAQGFLTRETSYASLEAIQLVQAGKTYLQPDLARGLLQYRADHPDRPLERLSAREYEILVRWAKGKTQENIAESLSVSIKTVYNLKSTSCEKLGAYTREQAAEYLGMRSKS